MSSIDKTPKIEGPVLLEPGHYHNWHARLKYSVIMAAIALSIGTIAPIAAAADIALLDAVEDRQVAILLETHFTLPLALGKAGFSDADTEAVIAAEVARLTALMTAQGYLEARIDISGGATQEDPLRLTPILGTRYRIGEIRVEGMPSQSDAQLRAALEALLSRWQGATALRSVVDDLGRGLLFELRQASHAEAVLRSADFTLDRGAAVADLVLTVDAGPAMRFGDVDFRGSLRVEEAEALALVPFRSGDPYSVTAVDGLRAALDRTGLFRRVRIETEVDPDRPDVIDLSVRLWDRAQLPMTEAQPRVLLATILGLGLIQAIRMTSLRKRPVLRGLLIVPVVVMIGGTALEVADRLHWFLYQ